MNTTVAAPPADDTHVSDLLPAFVNGTLDDATVATVAGHLAECAACRIELRAWQATAVAMRRGAIPGKHPAAELALHKAASTVRLKRARAMAGAASLSIPDRFSLLTRRELEVLRLIADGVTNDEIAEELGCNVDDVKANVGAILTKLDVRDRTQVVVNSIRAKMLGDEMPDFFDRTAARSPRSQSHSGQFVAGYDDRDSPITRDADVERVPLTAREIEVLRLIAEGKTDGEIADVIVVSRRTITTHVSSIFSKLGVESRQQAVERANQLGLT